jgi:ATP-binding cassette subfamily B protein
LETHGEFLAENAYHTNRSSPTAWVRSHLARSAPLVAGFLALALAANVCAALLPVVMGQAFTEVWQAQGGHLGYSALLLAALAIGQGGQELGAHYLAELVGQRLARDARAELYQSLLNKSLTVHTHLQVGEVMARVSNDVQMMTSMVAPAFDFLFLSLSNLLIMLIFIGVLSPQLLLVPLLYTAALALATGVYSRRLHPVAMSRGLAFGEIDRTLNEAIAGIQVVKASAQEPQELAKFLQPVRRYRDLSLVQARIQGRFLPNLLFGVALALALLQSVFLVSRHLLTLGQMITFLGLMLGLRSLTSFSYWTFAIVQGGMAGAERLLNLIVQHGELAAQTCGYQAEMRGDLVFEAVSFDYAGTAVLRDISFHARAGQTIAIVGQIGAGKSSLTSLVNRLYDVSGGRILLDGIDIRAWNLDSLRAQIATIEQEVFLFSRSIADNIAYGLRAHQEQDQAAIEAAARVAQAHEFIQQLPEGYQTEVGERGARLSGGQRQRLAIARALLANPRLLILDDATSAIDSATEDELHKALRGIQQGRTTLLITHRLSLIRQADLILLLGQGRLLDQGTHRELLGRSALYRRLFVSYEAAQPVPAGQS